MTAPRVLVAATVLLLAGTIAGVARRGTSTFTDDYEVTSGDWAADGGTARTDSPVFRARTTESSYEDVSVELRFEITSWHRSGRHGQSPHDWDGVHVGVRYGSPDDLYYVSLARRDGLVAIKRKADGRYETLATAPLQVDAGSWHRAVVTASDSRSGVVLTLAIDGQQVLRAVDVAAPRRDAGRVSLRSDNVTVTFADVELVT